MIPSFGHHLIPLLSSPGAAGALGSKAHLAAVKEACESAERIHGPLKMLGRFEVAVLPAVPDLFDLAPRMAKTRNLAWELIRNTRYLQWVILTRHPEFLSTSLPPTWIGKGFQNFCLGLVVEGGDGFAEKLQALRKAPVQRRMILIESCIPAVDLSGQLGGIDWVVFAGNSDDLSQASAIEASCREANVAFLFHQPGGDMESSPVNIRSDDAPQWPVHPFGTKIQLFQPTLPDLKPVSTVTPVPTAPSTPIENPPETLSPHTMKITDSPVPSTTTALTPTPESPTKIVEFEIVTQEPTDQKPDPELSGISHGTHEEFTQLDGVVRRGLVSRKILFVG